MGALQITPLALSVITSNEPGVVTIGDMDLGLTGARELMARLALAVEAAERPDNPGPWAQLLRRLDEDYARIVVVQFRDMDTRAIGEGSLCRVQGDRSMQPRLRIGKYLTANLRKRKDRWTGHVTRWQPNLSMYGSICLDWTPIATPTGMRVSVADSDVQGAPLTDGCGRLLLE